MNINISNWHNSRFDSTKMKFLLYISSLHDYWPPTTWISLVHNSLGEIEWFVKRALQLLKMRKKKVSWNIKTKCVTDFLLTGLRVWRITIVITWWAHKRQTFTLISIKLMWFVKFFNCNRVFKHKGVVSNLHVCCNGLGKIWASYIYHVFTKNSNLQIFKKI